MLTALDFWHLVEHIIPVYVIVIVAYALTKLNVIEPAHAPGISRWVSFLGVPTYVFHLLAFNDPYKTSLRLVGADVLSKALALLFGSLWWKLSKSGSIDGLISFFMLATLPNTVLIGEALLQPLYGDDVETQVVTIIFMQAVLWYNVCICLYEARVVLLEEKQAETGTAAVAQLPSGEKPKNDDHIIHLHESVFEFVTVHAASEAPLGADDRTPNSDCSTEEVISIELPRRYSSAEAEKKSYLERTDCSGHGSDEDSSGRKSLRAMMAGPGDGVASSQRATLERTISAPAGFFFSRSLSLKRTPRGGKVRDFDLPLDVLSGPFPEMKYAVERGAGTMPNEALVHAIRTGTADAGADEIIIFEKSGNINEASVAVATSLERDIPSVRSGRGGFSRWGILGLKMMNRVKRVPLTYASIAGFIYSLAAQKYDWDMPYAIQTPLELISKGAIGMAIFLMGMAWARTGRLVSCGWKGLVYGIVVRFLLGPILMIVSAKAVLMHGQSFRFAVLQAVIPQGVISFVLAKEYGVDVPLFNTAVIFQLVIFLPVVLCYYYILELV